MRELQQPNPTFIHERSNATQTLARSMWTIQLGSAIPMRFAIWKANRYIGKQIKSATRLSAFSWKIYCTYPTLTPTQFVKVIILRFKQRSHSVDWDQADRLRNHDHLYSKCSPKAQYPHHSLPRKTSTYLWLAYGPRAEWTTYFENESFVSRRSL